MLGHEPHSFENLRVVVSRWRNVLAGSDDFRVVVSQRLVIGAQKLCGFFYRPSFKRCGDYFRRHPISHSLLLRRMVNPVLARRHYFEVFDSVVQTVFVLVVHALSQCAFCRTNQRPPEYGFSNQPMLSDPPPRILQMVAWAKLPYIPVIQTRIPTLIRRKFVQSRRA